MPEGGPPIHAVIGVRHDGPSTWYVKRSALMANYPNVWSLPSVRYDPQAFVDPEDLIAAGERFARLSEDRLGGAEIRVGRFLVEDTSDMNPMGVDVTLRLYEIEMVGPIVPNPDFYVDSSWMSPEEYERASAGQPCGQCLRMWSDWAWLNGITDRPFVPTR